MKKTKSKVFIGIPIEFLKKGEVGYLLIGDVQIIIKSGSSMENLILQALISKSTTVFKFFLGECAIKIEKIGDGLEGTDFHLTFPNDFAFDVQRPNAISDEKFLSPVDVEGVVKDENNRIDLDIDYSKCSYSELCATFNAYLSHADFNIVKEKAYEILNYLPDRAYEYYLNFDNEALGECKAAIDETLEDIKGKRETSDVVKQFNDCLLETISIVKDKREEMQKVKGKKTLEERSTSDLKTLKKEAIKKSDFEEAAKIRDILTARGVAQEEK